MERKTLKLLAAFMMTSFSVISVVGATIAWFAANRKLNGGGMDIDPEAVDLKYDYFLYQYDISDLAHINVKGDPETGPKVFDLQNFSLHSYDTIFTNLNQYTYSLLRIKITGNSLSTGGTINASIHRDTSFDGDSSTLPRVFTSAIRFNTCVRKDLFASEPADIFSNAINYFKGTGIGSHFVPTADNSKVFPVNNGTAQNPDWYKPDYLNFTINYASSDYYESMLNIWVFLEYDTTLVTNFKQSTISGDLTGNEIRLENDLTKIKISCNGN